MLGQPGAVFLNGWTNQANGPLAEPLPEHFTPAVAAPRQTPEIFTLDKTQN